MHLEKSRAIAPRRGEAVGQGIWPALCAAGRGEGEKVRPALCAEGRGEGEKVWPAAMALEVQSAFSTQLLAMEH